MKNGRNNWADMDRDVVARENLAAALDATIPGWADLDYLELGEAVSRTTDGTRGCDGDRWGYHE